LEGSLHHEKGQALVALARAAVRAALLHEPIDASDDTRQAFAEPAGVFVTIRLRNGALRGCVGTTQPACASVPEEVIRIAPLAALNDWRFPPVELAELDNLSFEVSILSDLESIAGPEALNPHRYGVTVRDARGRTALLLPNIPSIETVARQLHEVKAKAGIPDDSPVRMWRFEVIKFAEHND
jgi:AmmeMemoRadiSam system protein A